MSGGYRAKYGIIFIISYYLEATSAGTQAKEVIRQYGFGTKGGLFTGCTATLGLFSSSF